MTGPAIAKAPYLIAWGRAGTTAHHKLPSRRRLPYGQLRGMPRCDKAPLDSLEMLKPGTHARASIWTAYERCDQRRTLPSKAASTIANTHISNVEIFSKRCGQSPEGRGSAQSPFRALWRRFRKTASSTNVHLIIGHDVTAIMWTKFFHLPIRSEKISGKTGVLSTKF